MMIHKSDKQYFNETIKKLLDERIQVKNFIDQDRPFTNIKELEEIKG